MDSIDEVAEYISSHKQPFQPHWAGSGAWHQYKLRPKTKRNEEINATVIIFFWLKIETLIRLIDTKVDVMKSSVCSSEKSRR